jgi:hypothetical protein
MNQYKKFSSSPLKCDPVVKIELLIDSFLCNHVRARMTIPAVASAPTYQYPPETSDGPRLHTRTCHCRPRLHTRLRQWRPRPSVLPALAGLPVVAHRVRARHPVRAIASAPSFTSAPACVMMWRSRWQPTWTR